MYVRTSNRLGQAIPAPIKPADATLFHFDKNSARLKDFHAVEIDRVADKIAASWDAGQPIFTVYVKGHSSPEGPAQYNIGLGIGRALAARKALQKALERKQRTLSYKVLILAQSKGAREPFATNESEEGKSQNRRVEVFLSTRKLLPKKTLPDYPPPAEPAPCDEKELQRRFDECDKKFNRCNEIADDWRFKEMLECGSDRECRNNAYRRFKERQALCGTEVSACKEKAAYAARCK